mmetsp:Transcript_104968/g.321576  ORF Transcript_104968/g.321576 Transcript_104968/m.321576 type:complete len:292 (-) Transcript_104968:805-1680(-)
MRPWGENTSDVIAAPMLNNVRTQLPSGLQSLTWWSADEVAIRCPSGGAKAAALTSSPWPSRAVSHSPVSMHHNLTVRSAAAVRRWPPRGQNATLFNPLVWPVNVILQTPSSAPQTFAVRSSDAVATAVPSCANTAAVTGPSWPRNVQTQAPSGIDQSLAVQSNKPTTKRRPSGDASTEFTQSPCPSARTWAPVSTSQNLTVLSAEPVAKSRGSQRTTSTTEPSCSPADASDIGPTSSISPWSNCSGPWPPGPPTIGPSPCSSPSECRPICAAKVRRNVETVSRGQTCNSPN